MRRSVEDMGLKIDSVEQSIFGITISWRDKDGRLGECDITRCSDGVWKIDSEHMASDTNKEFLAKLLDLLKEHILANSVIEG